MRPIHPTTCVNPRLIPADHYIRERPDLTRPPNRLTLAIPRYPTLSHIIPHETHMGVRSFWNGCSYLKWIDEYRTYLSIDIAHHMRKCYHICVHLR
ncbi:MAG: hypothetical protein KatS3mg056_1401 [Chloroflexus sp.]|nr:MAG: hypothetical protein KatS3mg056_1401 [Chloroflexus sp.]